MDSCGIMSMIARATVSPPTPESKTPIGASDIVPHHVAHQRFLEPGERLVQHAQPHPLRIDYRVRGVTRRERMLSDFEFPMQRVRVIVRVEAEPGGENQPHCLLYTSPSPRD